MRVGMLDTRAQFQEIRTEMLEAAERVLASGQWIGGEELSELERELAERIGARHAIGVASGTDALILSLKALGVGPGVDVVVPTFTFFATAGAVVNAGGRPIFADVEPATLCLDPASFDSVRTTRTRVVIPVHLYGQCADMPRIREIGARSGIAVLE
ncbi:MAG: hypothetical protein GF346_13260, partial [Candidatus Eisenbacteria bacterium]|nr:hypothetical protein [Candidatus Latescibacterota bacterium]MBD3303408.1 hypothetical protein [Candidatus Eisenbacteria bacterium]